MECKKEKTVGLILDSRAVRNFRAERGSIYKSDVFLPKVVAFK
jgi:hypothetical protein